MARQPNRSAFWLTINILKYYQIIIRIILLITINHLTIIRSSTISSNYNNNNNENNENNVNSNSNYLTIINNNNNNSNNSAGQQPKFGDRLLPRHRQFSQNNNQSTISGIVQNISNNNYNINSLGTTTTTNSSAHNLLNNNDNFLSVQPLNIHNNNDHFYNDHYQDINTDQIINSSLSDSVNHFHIYNNNNNNNDRNNDDPNNNKSKSNSIKYFSNINSGHSNNNSSSNSNSISSSSSSGSNSNSNSGSSISTRNHHYNNDDGDNISNLWWFNNGDHIKNPNNVIIRNDQDSNDQDEIDAIVHDVVGSSQSQSSANDQQQQQHLRRRNDYNIDRNDLLDHHHTTNLNVSKADRLIEMSTEFFIIPSSTPSSSNNGQQDITHNHNQQYRNFHDHQQQQQPIQRGSLITPRPVLIVAPRTPSSNLSSMTPPSIISTSLHMDGLRKEPWVVPVLVLASLSMIMMAAFEIFVLFKAWRTSPSRRHLFLGQMLLLGLFACAGLGAVLTANPTILSCATIRFGVGVAYALVFAALLVKCVFLISLNGGVYLPAPYQGLLLLFAVLIQVAIGAQWLMTQSPDIHTLTVPIGSNVDNKFSMLITSTDITRVQGTQVITLCKTQFSELLLSLIYIVFLIIFVTVLAIKSRGIRDNYRESTYIGLAIGGAIPIWLGWTLCGLAVTDRHKDACIAFGLIATSSTVFLVMFMPKGRQLAAMGKEGLYVEDREDQFSSLSRAGSGYSPSFFHFKPIKYGVMGHNNNHHTINNNNNNNNNNQHHHHMQNSTTNTTNLNGTIGCTTNGTNIKHQNGATLGGDHVALVAAGPPSYTRMYHYFPAHLTHPFCFYPPLPPPPLSPPLSPLKAIGNHTPTSAHIAQTIRYPGLFMRPDDTNVYTTLEPTLSSNPNVYFQRSGGVHPGMMY